MLGDCMNQTGQDPTARGTNHLETALITSVLTDADDARDPNTLLRPLLMRAPKIGIADLGEPVVWPRVEQLETAPHCHLQHPEDL